MSSADDELVWSIPSGSVLMCAQDLVMEGALLHKSLLFQR